MKQTSRFLSLCLLAIFVLPGGAFADAYESQAKQHSFYAEILKKSETAHGLEMVQFLSAKLREDMGRIHAASVWLRDNSVAQKDSSRVDSLYYLIYSDLIFLMSNAQRDMGQEKEATQLAQMAMQVLYAFEIMAMADAARCEDKSVPEALGMNTLWERYQSPEVLSAYKVIPKESFDRIAEIALMIEDQHAARRPNKDICRMGAAQTADMLAQPGVKTVEVEDPSFAGGKRTEIIAPAGYVYEPKLLSDAEWSRNRADFRAKYAQIWAGRYVKNTGPGLQEKK